MSVASIWYIKMQTCSTNSVVEGAQSEANDISPDSQAEIQTEPESSGAREYVSPATPFQAPF